MAPPRPASGIPGRTGRTAASPSPTRRWTRSGRASRTAPRSSSIPRPKRRPPQRRQKGGRSGVAGPATAQVRGCVGSVAPAVVVPFRAMAPPVADDDLDRGSEAVLRGEEVTAAMPMGEPRVADVMPAMLPGGVVAVAVPAVLPDRTMATVVLYVLAPVMPEAGRDRPVVIPPVQPGAVVGEGMVLPPATIVRRRHAGHARDQGEGQREENRRAHGASFAMMS